MSCKEEETHLQYSGDDSVICGSNSVDSNSISLKNIATRHSTDTIVVSNDFAVLSGEQPDSYAEMIENESLEGASAEEPTENGLNNAEVQLSAKDVDVERSENQDGASSNPQLCVSELDDENKVRAVQHTSMNSGTWGHEPSGLGDASMFTRRRDSSSDSVDSESSSSSSSSDWDSSSDTAHVSDDSVRGPPAPVASAKPRRAVLPSVKTKGEFTLDDLPPIEDLHISLPEGECKELGAVVSIVDQLVVVEPHRDLPTLNLDSVLFLDHGKRAMGHVFDVFGRVKEPLYCVRFNSVDHIRDTGVSVGTKVYCAPDTPYTNYVFVNQLLSLRGSDASWEQDNEPPSSVVFYSDDEEEREARRKSQHEKSKLRTGESGDGSPATQEPKPKRLNLMEERNNRRNLLLNATYSSSSQHGKRQARGRGWVAPNPDDFIIKPSSFSFSTNWQPAPQNSQPDVKPRFPPPSSSPAANSPLFGVCRPPQFPFAAAGFSVPPPFAAGKSLFGVLQSQSPDMLTFVQPPPSGQPPVRTFPGSGGFPFVTSQRPPSMAVGTPRPPEVTAVQPRPFGSPVAISFRPMQCPPGVLTSPPPPLGISFNVVQHPPNLSTRRLGAVAMTRPFVPPNCMTGMGSQRREYADAATTSKQMVFDPSHPPPNLPFNSSATGKNFSGSSPQSFSPVSRVVLNPASNTSNSLARGVPCQQQSRAALPFNPARRPPVPQQSSPPVFAAPWSRDPWHTPGTSPRPSGVWSRLPGDVWQPRAPGTPPCPTWQVPSTSWRPPGTARPPVWQTCDQPLVPGQPALVQFDVLRLRSPPPPPQSSSESSFYR